MIEQYQELNAQEAPYVVEFHPTQNGHEGLDIWPWFLENNAKGLFCSRLLIDEDGNYTGYTFHFTDADTAFWFRMRFG